MMRQQVGYPSKAECTKLYVFRAMRDPGPSGLYGVITMTKTRLENLLHWKVLPRLVTVCLASKAPEETTAIGK